MRSLAKLVFTLTSALLCVKGAYAVGFHHNDDHKQFLGPTLKARYTSFFVSYDDTAFSLLAEAGAKNFRIGGTLGWQMLPLVRLKGSIDFLKQENSYTFFHNHSDLWNDQLTGSAALEFDLCHLRFKPQFELASYYSYAPSTEFQTRYGFFFTQPNTFTFPNLPTQRFYANARRIAGSNAFGLIPGITIQPWCGARLGADLNYDFVNYDVFYRPDTDANGVGGTLRFDQWVWRNINLGIMAAWRKPYNNYTANLTWINIPWLGKWGVGLEGTYTLGKNHLPDSYNVSLTADYFYDPCPCFETYFSTPVASCNGIVMAPVRPYRNYRLLNWTSHPAAYHPQVLVISNELVDSVPVNNTLTSS